MFESADVPVFVLNGWAAENAVWGACRFPRTRLFDYLEQLDGVPERVLADVPAFILVGFSMGGTTALMLALRFPERVRGLVLVSATARMMEDPATDWKGMSLRRRAALKLGTQITTRGNPSPLFAEANLDRGLDCLEQTDLRAELRALPSASNLRRVPVAIFQSARDGIVRPPNAEFLQTVFPQASVQMIPGGEHTLPPLIPDRLDAAVDRCRIAAAKAALRREMRARRKTVSPDERARVSRDICGQILVRRDIDAALARGGALAVYLASPEEIDLTDAIRGMLARGVNVVAPRWNGASYELAKLRGLGAADLRLGPMNIAEPRVADLVEPAAVAVWLVPGLAFARDGGRLGYGGGWYDRFLAAAASDSLACGVAYDFQLVETLPTASHDHALQIVIRPHQDI